MHDRVVTDGHVRRVLQAHVLDDAAEVDPSHPGVVAVLDVQHPARYG
jgi:hypothetical protein